MTSPSDHRLVTPSTLHTAILACVAEEPGSTPSDVRAMLAERGIRPAPPMVNTALTRLAARGRLVEQTMPAGHRTVHCYRLPLDSTEVAEGWTDEPAPEATLP
jgi:hypothetical protein